MRPACLARGHPATGPRSPVIKPIGSSPAWRVQAAWGLTFIKLTPVLGKGAEDEKFRTGCRQVIGSHDLGSQQRAGAAVANLKSWHQGGVATDTAGRARAHAAQPPLEGRAPLAGDLAVFCRPVVTAPAVVRRDGTVLAGTWLPDLVRLGELEAHLGDGVIEAAVDAAMAAGRLKPRQRRRIMSYPLVIRLVIAMTLMPDSPYCEALARLAGLLADIPFALEWHVPTAVTH